MRPHYLAALCLLAGGACKKKAGAPADPAPSPPAGQTPASAPEPVPDAAARLRAGIAAALASPETRTGDLGGRANTAQYTDAVIRAMGESAG